MKCFLIFLAIVYISILVPLNGKENNWYRNTNSVEEYLIHFKHYFRVKVTVVCKMQYQFRPEFNHLPVKRVKVPEQREFFVLVVFLWDGSDQNEWEVEMINAKTERSCRNSRGRRYPRARRLFSPLTLMVSHFYQGWGWRTKNSLARSIKPSASSIYHKLRVSFSLTIEIK